MLAGLTTLFSESLQYDRISTGVYIKGHLYVLISLFANVLHLYRLTTLPATA
jgi:hypothetical protein